MEIVILEELLMTLHKKNLYKPSTKTFSSDSALTNQCYIIFFIGFRSADFRRPQKPWAYIRW